eukprot:12670335-Ditylum_brightwellii.AAC.1
MKYLEHIKDDVIVGQSHTVINDRLHILLLQHLSSWNYPLNVNVSLGAFLAKSKGFIVKKSQRWHEYQMNDDPVNSNGASSCDEDK